MRTGGQTAGDNGAGQMTGLRDDVDCRDKSHPWFRRFQQKAGGDGQAERVAGRASGCRHRGWVSKDSSFAEYKATKEHLFELSTEGSYGARHAPALEKGRQRPQPTGESLNTGKSTIKYYFKTITFWFLI